MLIPRSFFFQMASNLHCMCAACDHENQEMLEQYDSWNWFFRNQTQDPMDTCHVNSSTVDCRLFDPQFTPGWWQKLMKVTGFFFSALLPSYFFGGLHVGQICVIWYVDATPHPLTHPPPFFSPNGTLPFLNCKILLARFQNLLFVVFFFKTMTTTLFIIYCRSKFNW